MAETDQRGQKDAFFKNRMFPASEHMLKQNAPAGAVADQVIRHRQMRLAEPDQFIQRGRVFGEIANRGPFTGGKPMAREIVNRDGKSLIQTLADQVSEYAAVIEIPVKQKHRPPGMAGQKEMGRQVVGSRSECPEKMPDIFKMDAVIVEISDGRGDMRRLNAEIQPRHCSPGLSDKMFHLFLKSKKIRNPNVEIRNKFEIRMLKKSEIQMSETSQWVVSNFEFWSFGFVSGFGFRISDFSAHTCGEYHNSEKHEKRSKEKCLPEIKHIHHQTGENRA